MTGELMVCEICGSHSPELGGWFAVAEAGNRMEVLPWTESLRERSDCRHACCGDHVQQLVFSAATHDLPTPLLSISRESGGWNPAALTPEADEKSKHSIQSVLDAIDVALAGETLADDEDSAAFDA
jgi:hypothetical protein